MNRSVGGLPLWSGLTPLLALVLLFFVWDRTLGVAGLVLVLLALFAVVQAAVFHAEVIAERVGDPFGALVLALAITVIEVSLIVALMLSGGDAARALARDTVYATVMIICNGVVGISLMAGAWRHRALEFRVEGTMPALSILATLTVLVLVLPNFTSTTPGPTLSPAQLVFAGIVSLVLYAVFVFAQTVRHRDLFIAKDELTSAPAPDSISRNMPLALVLLALALVAVVGLAKVMAPSIEAGVIAVGAPHAVVGIAISLMVLLPESVAALRSARANRMQTSFNLALGSALATIGLTIPAVAITSLGLGLQLELGLPPKDIALLVLTLMISVMTLGRGRATVMQGAVHLVLFAVFLFLAVVP
jgi:Ca2+:H+ antiporter